MKGIEPEAEHPEVDLGHLARRRLGDAHRHGRGAEAEVGLREAMQRTVRHGHALRPQPAVDLREAQPRGQPRRDLLAMRGQPVWHVTGTPAGGGTDGRDHRGHLLVRRARLARRQPRGPRGGHVLGHRLPIAPRGARDRAHPVSQAEPTQHLASFDHTQLPIGHDHLRGRG
jgi:hypothetical protein